MSECEGCYAHCVEDCKCEVYRPIITKGENSNND